MLVGVAGGAPRVGTGELTGVFRLGPFIYENRDAGTVTRKGGELSKVRLGPWQSSPGEGR